MGGRFIIRLRTIAAVLVVSTLLPAPAWSADWSQITLTGGILPLENRIAVFESSMGDPDLLVFTLWSTGTNMNHLGAFVVPPPYNGTGATFTQDIDIGALFGVGNICVTADDRAVVPYIKANGGNFDVFVAEFNGLNWSTNPIPATSTDDYHTTDCFLTSDGVFLMVLNVTDDQWEFYQAPLPTEASFGPEPWVLVDTLGEPELGALPQDPFIPMGGIAFAESPNLFGDPILTPDFNAGLPVVDDLDGYLLIGSANSSDIDGSYLPRNYEDPEFEQNADLPLRRREGTGDDVLWVTNQANGQLLLTRVGLSNPGLDLTVTLGPLDPGSLLSFQGLGVAEGPDGNVYVLADKAYQVTPDLASATVMTGYPFNGLGGPVNLVFPRNMAVGFAVGPGSQVLGILDMMSVFADGFESADTGAWSNTSP